MESRDRLHLQLFDVVVHNKYHYDESEYRPAAEPDFKRGRFGTEEEIQYFHDPYVSPTQLSDHLGQEIVLKCINEKKEQSEYIVNDFSPYFTMDIPLGRSTDSAEEARDFLNNLFEFIKKGKRPILKVRLVRRRGFITAFAPATNMWEVHFTHTKYISPLREHLFYFGDTTYEHLGEFAPIYHAWRMFQLEKKYGDRIPTNESIDIAMEQVYKTKPRILRKKELNTVDDFFSGMKREDIVVDRRKPMSQLDTYLMATKFAERHGLRTYESNYELVHRFCTDTQDIGGMARISLPRGTKSGSVIDAADIINHKDIPENFPFDIMSFDFETSFDPTLPSWMSQVDKAETNGEIYQIGLVSMENGATQPKKSWLFTWGGHCNEINIRPDQRNAMFDPTVKVKGEKVMHREYLDWCVKERRDDGLPPEFMCRADKRFFRDKYEPVLDTRRYPLICRDLNIDPLQPPKYIQYDGREWTLDGYKATGPVYRDLTWYTVTDETPVLPDGHEVITVQCTTELEMMTKFLEILQKYPWLVLTGHNICGFDLPFWVGRARHYFGKGCLKDRDRGDYKNPLLQWGTGKHATLLLRKSTMGSKQRTKADTYEASIEGRLVYDGVRVFRREYKLRSNRLGDIAHHFYADKKINMSYENITPLFKGTYVPREKKKEVWFNDTNTPMTPQEMREYLGVYCWWDCILPLRNMAHQHLLDKDIQKCRVIGTFLYELDGRGTSILVHKRIMGYTSNEDIVMPYYKSPPEGLDYEDEEDDDGNRKKKKIVKAFSGGLVVHMYRGYYTDPIIVIDFSSLYPSIMRCYNICYSTWVERSNLANVMVLHGLEDEEDVFDFVDTEDGTEKHQKPYAEIKHLVDKHFHCSPDPINEHFLIAWAIDRDVIVQEDEREAYLQSKGIERVKGEHEHEYLEKRFWKRADGTYHPRVLKFEGVLPRMEADLLSERNRVKGLMKVAVKMGNVTLEMVYDGQQLSVKLVMNGAFGYTGAMRGKLFLRALAASITAWGQVLNVMTQQRILEWICMKYPEEFRGTDDPKLKKKILYGDSLTGDSPLIVRKDGLIMVRRIDDIASGEWSYTLDHKECADSDFEVWTHKGWSPIRTVIRHKTDKDIVRITTYSGTVDVTEDHSLMRKDGSKVKPKDIKVGDVLLHHELDLTHMKTHDYGMTEDDAYLWGAFHGGGCSSRGNNGAHVWSIGHASESYILSLQKRVPFPTRIYKVKVPNTTYRLCPSEQTRSIADYYRSLFYTSNGEKHVPDQIIHAPLNIVKAYMEGFHSRHTYHNTEQVERRQVIEFKGKENAQGLYLLEKRLGVRRYINTVKSQKSIVSLTEFRAREVRNPHAVRKMYKVDNCSEYVYDVSTLFGSFQGGVGELTCSNTDSVMVRVPHHDTVEQANFVQKEICDYINLAFGYPVRLLPEKTLINGAFKAPKMYYFEYYPYTPDGPGKPFTFTQGMNNKRRNDNQLTRDMTKALADIGAHHPSTAFEDSLWYVGGIIADLCERNWEAIKWDMLTKSVELKKKPHEYASTIPAQMWAWEKWIHYAASAPDLPPKIGERIEYLPMQGGPSMHPVPDEVMQRMPKRLDKKGVEKKNITKGMWYFPWWGPDADYDGRTPNVKEICEQVIKTAAKVLFPHVIPEFEEVKDRNRKKVNKKEAMKEKTDEEQVTSAEDMAVNKIVSILNERYMKSFVIEIPEGEDVRKGTMLDHVRVKRRRKEERTPEEVWRATFRPLDWKRQRQKRAMKQMDIGSFFQKRQRVE